MSASPVRVALYERLKNTAALTSQLSAPTAIHYHVAPQSAQFPLVVFGELDGRPEWAFQGAAFERDVWQVRGVATSATKADEIGRQIALTLDDAPLSPAGVAVLYLRRRSRIAYAEQDGATTYWHQGWQFSLVTEPSS